MGRFYGSGGNTDNDNKNDYNSLIKRKPVRTWVPVNGLVAVLIVTVLFIISIAAYQLIAFAGGIETDSPSTDTETTDTDISGTDNTGNTDAGLNELARQIAQQADQLNILTRKRSDIIDALIVKSAELSLNIDIDTVTGSVRFSEALFFEKNSEQINETGRQYLTAFVPAYLSAVTEIAGESLEQIVIEGHSDEDGTYLYNLNLSQRRAYSVAAFIFENDLAKVDGISEPERLISISGRSYSVPVHIDDVVDREKSRRVEFKFRLKDEDTINGLKALFDSFLQEGAGD